MTLAHAIAVLEIAAENARNNGSVAFRENRDEDVEHYAEHIASYDQAISILKSKE